MRGKRRLHRKPSMAQIGACRPVVGRGDLDRPARDPGCLGATAAQAILGRSFRLTQPRGELLDAEGVQPKVVATVHPASILRATDDRAREEQRSAFVDDLARAAHARRTMHARDGGR